MPYKYNPFTNNQDYYEINIGTGDVVGPGSSTAGDFAVFADTTGKLLADRASPLAVSFGGTGQTTLTNHGVLVGAGTTAITQLATGSSGQILQSGGASADPAYSTATYPSTAGTTGNVLTSNGTNFVSSAPAAGTKITTFLSSGSWTIDPKTVWVEFFLWGGGGGGGSGRCGVSAGAGGGGGGGPGNLLHSISYASLLTSSPYTVTVGDGGDGGISINAVTTNGNPGSIGGSTSVGTGLVVTGGSGGNGGANGAATGGTGVYIEKFGLTLALTGTSGGTGVITAPSGIQYAWAGGGGGASGYLAATPRTGGGSASIVDLANTVLVAGGSGGANTGATAGNGNAPSGVSMIMGATGGGGGGHDGTVTAGTGGAGAQPGGGGGGGAGNLSSNASGAGGKGGKGQVIIIEYF